MEGILADHIRPIKQLIKKGLLPTMGSQKIRSLVRWLALAAIVLPIFHIVSTLLLAVLGLSPSSSRWPLLLTFAGVLATAGTAVGLQSTLVDLRSLRPQSSSANQNRAHHRLHTLVGTVSGVASGAILGFYTGGQLSDQQTLWALIGLGIGSVGIGGLARWAHSQQVTSQQTATIKTMKPGLYRFASFCRSAIAFSSGLHAYGLTFGLGAWTWMAISAGRIGLAVLLALLSMVYLWCTRQAITLALHYLKQ